MAPEAISSVNLPDEVSETNSHDSSKIVLPGAENINPEYVEGYSDRAR
jgi:hypothetical protein